MKPGVGGGTGAVSYDGQLRDYVYRVTAGANQPDLDTVFIGTHDADRCSPTAEAIHDRVGEIGALRFHVSDQLLLETSLPT